MDSVNSQQDFQKGVDMVFQGLYGSQGIKPQRELQKITNKETKNLAFELQEVQVPVGIQFSAIETASFIPYNSQDDEIDDYGWGCAWRAIEMVLSSLQDKPKFTFSNLFTKFGNKEILEILYQRKYQATEYPESLKKKEWAPHDLINGWAEPFIGHLILEYYGANSKLYLLNNYPFSNATQDVYEPVKLKFETFRNLLIQNFKRKNCSPVMIDDGTFAKVIIGIGYDEETKLTTLWMGDPHIQNNREPGNQMVGLYTVTLDSQGELVEVQYGDKQMSQNYYCKGTGVFAANDFSMKNGWMVLIRQY